MTLNMPQIVQETCMLVAKLQDRDRLADSLISQAQMLNEKITCMKQYQDQLHEMNEVVHHRPRSALVYNLQQENRQIKLLESENRQLKAALQEHHAALELIMAKYRQHVLQLLKLNRLQELIEQQCHGMDPAESITDRTRLLDFAHLFDQCLKSGEVASRKDQMEIARLQVENESLRRVVQAAMVNQPGLAKEHRRIRQELMAERVEFQNDTKDAKEPVAHADPSVSATEADDATPEAEDKTFASGIADAAAADTSNANVVVPIPITPAKPNPPAVETVVNNNVSAAKSGAKEKVSTIKKSSSGGVASVLNKLGGSEAEPTDPSGPHGQTSNVFKRTSSAKTPPSTNAHSKQNFAKRKSADESGTAAEGKNSSSSPVATKGKGAAAAKSSPNANKS